MRIRWSPEAYEDLAAIGRRIREDDPGAALRTVTTIYDSATALNTFPNRGRKGRVEGTRELPLSPLRSSSFIAYFLRQSKSSTSFTARNAGLNPDRKSIAY